MAVFGNACSTSGVKYQIHCLINYSVKKLNSNLLEFIVLARLTAHWKKLKVKSGIHYMVKCEICCLINYSVKRLNGHPYCR